MLSSHFVHFLLKKNISYQNRSKYKSDIFNMNANYYYIYTFTKMLSYYVKVSNTNLYFFTNNMSKKNEIIDADFNKSISN